MLRDAKGEASQGRGEEEVTQKTGADVKEGIRMELVDAEQEIQSELQCKLESVGTSR